MKREDGYYWVKVNINCQTYFDLDTPWVIMTWFNDSWEWEGRNTYGITIEQIDEKRIERG